MWLTYENLTRKTKNKVQESRPEPNWIPWPWPQQIVAVTAVTQTVLPYLALSKVALILKLLTPSVRCPKICPSFLVESHPCLWMFHIVSHCFTLFHSSISGSGQVSPARSIFEYLWCSPHDACLGALLPTWDVHRPSSPINHDLFHHAEFSGIVPLESRVPEGRAARNQPAAAAVLHEKIGHFWNIQEFSECHVRVRRQLRAGEFGQFAVGTQSMEVRRDLRVSLENCFCLLGWWACP